MRHAKEINFAFFGTPDFSVTILEELKKNRIIPALVITAPDRPKGRGLKVTPPPVKVWAEEKNIEFLQPQKLDEAISYKLKAKSYDLFVVAAYGNILSKELLEIPKHGTLNVHPSLLPKLRGASPIQSAILNDERDAVGVTIMLIDEKLDHGPIVAQASVEIETWPPKTSVLEELLAREGGKLLAEVIPLWVKGKITPEAQDHRKATYSRKITKEDGLIDLKDDAYENFRKIQAFDIWPGAYFFAEKNGKNIRVKITDAELQFPRGSASSSRRSAHKPQFVIKKVIPEGKREMSYTDFLKGLKRN